jgi:hypothetical protein
VEIRELLERLIVSRRFPSEEEVSAIRERVAGAGFDPQPLERAGGRAAGVIWGGRTVAPGDRLPPAVAHYLRHVVNGNEWPARTTLRQYLRSLREIVRDPSGGVLLSRFHGAWHVSFVRRSGTLRGPEGYEWVLVEYSIGLGHWVTAFQLRLGLAELEKPFRESSRWWQPPV